MFIGMALGWLLSIVAVLLTVGLAANAVWRAVVPPAGLGRAASCGSCGYELATVEGGRCSECGADLLKAGVMTRRNAVRLAGSLPAALMGWTVIVMVLWSVTAMIVSWVGMMSMGVASQAYTSSFNFTPRQYYDEDTGQFASSAAYSIAVDCDVVGGWGMPAESGTITATVEHGEAETEFVMDAVTGEWSYTDAEGAAVAGEGDFTAEDAAALYGLVGLDTGSNPALAHEASQFHELMASSLRDPFNYESTLLDAMPQGDVVPDGGLMESGGDWDSSGGPFSASWTTEATILVVASGVGVVVWVAGLVWIVRRRARIVAGPRAAAAA